MKSRLRRQRLRRRGRGEACDRLRGSGRPFHRDQRICKRPAITRSTARHHAAADALFAGTPGAGSDRSAGAEGRASRDLSRDSIGSRSHPAIRRPGTTSSGTACAEPWRGGNACGPGSAADHYAIAARRRGNATRAADNSAGTTCPTDAASFASAVGSAIPSVTGASTGAAIAPTAGDRTDRTIIARGLSDPRRGRGRSATNHPPCRHGAARWRAP